ncbi:BTB/POZ domain-containing protein At5g17580 [Carica papaya]|uniref:BTB/POZ domain-containing protein At5g17580 n=1 Tax=Carica papaya TaxID=3649 RepID=UPI000B8CDA7A|nr:BTB/POZ domain-containing protein At5g17580 [Carica papaya]
MTERYNRNASSWLMKSAASSADVRFNINGVPFSLDRELLAARSAKVSTLLKRNSPELLPHLLQDIPADPETFEIVARFCHGFEPELSSESIVPLICLAYYLGMDESHSTNNMLTKALTFFEQRVLPSWNETIKAFRAAETVFQQAVDLGLVDACLKSIVAKTLLDPCFLGESIKTSVNEDDSDDDANKYRPNARRRLFVPDWQPENLITLSLQLYELVIHAVNQHGVPSEHIAASIFQYANRWVLSGNTVGDNMLVYKNFKRDVIEAVETLLPQQIGLVACSFLFEMLHCAIIFEASSDCRTGFEIRIGKQLDQATVKDLLIPVQGYAREMQYDVECVRRILKIFYSNFSTADISGFLKVSELMEGFLAEVANDIDLKADTFISLAEMSVAASFGTQRTSDGIYRAIDIYLDKHRYIY